jgi:hypothetical protein
VKDGRGVEEALELIAGVDVGLEASLDFRPGIGQRRYAEMASGDQEGKVKKARRA